MKEDSKNDRGSQVYNSLKFPNGTKKWKRASQIRGKLLSTNGNTSHSSNQSYSERKEVAPMIDPNEDPKPPEDDGGTKPPDEGSEPRQDPPAGE
jgi:hypothetical protein